MAKIRVIDLLNLITKCEQPKRIEVLGHKFSWNSLEGFYEEVNDRNDLFELTNSYPSYEFLDFEVKIENKKEQQDIDIQEITMFEQEYFKEHESNMSLVEVDLAIKINEILQWAKQLDKNIKDKE